MWHTRVPRTAHIMYRDILVRPAIHVRVWTRNSHVGSDAWDFVDQQDRPAIKQSLCVPVLLFWIAISRACGSPGHQHGVEWGRILKRVHLYSPHDCVQAFFLRQSPKLFGAVPREGRGQETWCAEFTTYYEKVFVLGREPSTPISHPSRWKRSHFSLFPDQLCHPREASCLLHLCTNAASSKKIL